MSKRKAWLLVLSPIIANGFFALIVWLINLGNYNYLTIKYSNLLLNLVMSLVLPLVIVLYLKEIKFAKHFAIARIAVAGMVLLRAIYSLLVVPVELFESNIPYVVLGGIEAVFEIVSLVFLIMMIVYMRKVYTRIIVPFLFLYKYIVMFLPLVNRDFFSEYHFLYVQVSAIVGIFVTPLTLFFMFKDIDKI